MTAYEELMLAINGKTEQVDSNEQSLWDKTKSMVTDVITTGYAKSVDTMGVVAGAVEINVRATPKLFNGARLRAREEHAKLLLSMMNK